MVLKASIKASIKAYLDTMSDIENLVGHDTTSVPRISNSTHFLDFAI